ncbi:MAG: hypothetical protein QGI24_01540 [Kiritimatiellia bacterium]|jgi:hypothetical protein|nr:hypothetical protein [Kiritimatiellia bacterium]MDP6847446.1 hypothetical protein [Kiritimatiellia bacterium]
MKNTLRLAVLSAVLVVLTGCATPAARIRRNPEMFAAFPPEVRENVEQGIIDLGYSKEMVFIALGSPDRDYSRVTGEAETEVWSYVDLDYRPDTRPVSTAYYYRDAHGHMRRASHWTWIDVGTYIEYESLRVEFQGGAVNAIEALKP